MRFEHGDAVAPLIDRGPAPSGKKGTRVTFFASSDTFTNVIEVDFEKLEHRYRSEEHTSELQTLMRIAYAIFCLNNTTQTNPTSHKTNQVTILTSTTDNKT